MSRRCKIAIVDDETVLAEVYAEYLADLGHEVTMLPSTAELDALLARGPVDVIVLDLNLPGERGLDALRRLRDTCPVVILSAQADLYERVAGLELGADDVVAKPVDPRELAARILNVLRRYGRIDRDVIAFERTAVDLTASCLLRPGQAPERLSPGEILLIKTFAARRDDVLTRDELIALAPAESHDVDGKAIDRRIARLRAKLETELIVTVRGRGYMLASQPP